MKKTAGSNYRRGSSGTDCMWSVYKILETATLGTYSKPGYFGLNLK